MNIGPCEPWPAIWCCDLIGASPAATGYALEAATEVLWALSGRQFGECLITGLRPCRDECADVYGSAPWHSASLQYQWPSPALINSQWYNLGCGGCLGACTCNTVSQFTLPSGATRVVAIYIDGEVMPTGSYQTFNHRYVERIDGGEWPRCNDDGLWTITVAVGAEVPVIGQMAVGELACQIYSLCGDNDCELPVNARRVTRQGVTVDTPELTSIVATGALGLQYVNSFLAAFNPNQLQSRSRSFSPDNPAMRYPT